MTPLHKIMQKILSFAKDEDERLYIEDPANASIEEIQEAYDRLREDGYNHECESEIRGGEFETDIAADWDRHYESKGVASKMLDGSWVGWTYWYGGGKHGEPSSIDWMEYAYDLDCVEELVMVRKFTEKNK